MARKSQPFPSEGFKSSPHISLRMPPELKARLQLAMKEDGYNSLGTWLKHLATSRANALGVPEQPPAPFQDTTKAA